MRWTVFLLEYFLVKVLVLLCRADGEAQQQLEGFIMLSGSNGSRDEQSGVSEAPHTEDKCRGYYDVMGQWDPPFVCQTGDYLYCCGTCGFRFCCAYKNSRLDQNTCKNYDTPEWLTGQTPYKKTDPRNDPTKDKTNLIVYVICGVVAIMALVGIFTKLGLEKAHRPHRESMSRAVASVMQGAHQGQHEEAIGMHTHHYDIVQARANNMQGGQINSMMQTHPYPALSQMSHVYEQQQPGKEFNKYASLKAVDGGESLLEAIRLAMKWDEFITACASEDFQSSSQPEDDGTHHMEVDASATASTPQKIRRKKPSPSAKPTVTVFREAEEPASDYQEEPTADRQEADCQEAVVLSRAVLLTTWKRRKREPIPQLLPASTEAIPLPLPALTATEATMAAEAVPSSNCQCTWPQRPFPCRCQRPRMPFPCCFQRPWRLFPSCCYRLLRPLTSLSCSLWSSSLSSSLRLSKRLSCSLWLSRISCSQRPLLGWTTSQRPPHCWTPYL
ncbi:uncharacterized protein LOC127626536 isoform X1 [Xyrauchen texanus]|uniref:uncharacterized protein LOC127626536 isoform X1 n=1 Tax=Xyrauchen texanus TaxID=154827 RepID=UPI0022423D46|nr:uncharacterized protein LOC127626536 isoform X1 [Xyrauchen texanus]